MLNNKPLCIFVHGWGMNHAVWQPVITAMPASIEIRTLNLPGHGDATASTFHTLHDLAVALKNACSRPAIWVGWSLGGMATLQLALEYPELASGLMLVASTPCFVHRDDWQHGMKPELFDNFAFELENDFANTIKRFLSLQVKNSEQGRQLLKQIRQQILQQPAANPQALHAGLKILKNSDLRPLFSSLKIPLAIALGTHDSLVNIENQHYYQTTQPNADIQLYEHAAHAPFLSHLPQFTAQLIRLVKTTHDQPF